MGSRKGFGFEPRTGTLLGRASALRLPPVGKAEPEELPLPRSCHSTFRPVHLQLELTFKESCEPSHQALACLTTADRDIAIVDRSTIPMNMLQSGRPQSHRKYASPFRRFKSNVAAKTLY
jgi:hypothetical protein